MTTLKHILRRLGSFPVFTAITIATLAIGIGANSAIFAVIENVLLKPLPFPDSAQLVDLGHDLPGIGLHGRSEPLYATPDVSYVVRTPRAGSSALMQEFSQAVWSVSKELPLANPQTLEDLYNKSLARTSFALLMLGIAGAMAFALGIAGLYGVISYSVAQRTREIGIRVAIGAQHSTVQCMFIAEGARLAAIGILCGTAAALGLMRLMASLLFGVKPIDPLTYAAVALGLAAAAVIASYIPAMRATKVDPVDALRAE